jgi:O-antigen/teichoic acid export membrane protein
VKRYLQRFRESTLAKNAAWLFMGQGLSFVLQAGYFLVLARLLGSTEYGIYAAATALVSIISQYSSMGSGLVFLQHVSPDHSKFPAYWGNILISTLGVGSALVLAVHLTGHWLVGAASASILVVVAIGDCVWQQLTSCSGQVFQTFEKMKITATLNMAVNLLRLLIAVGMLLVLHHATSRQWAWAALTVSTMAALFAFTAVTLNFGAPKFSLELFAKRAGDGFIYSVSASTTTIYNDIDKVLLGHFGMNAANGIYTMAYRVVNICTMPMVSIYSAAFPKFFRLGTEGMRSTVPYARRLLKRTSVLGVLAALGMFLTAPLIPHLVGKSFAQSVSALRWLCLIPFFRSFHLSAGDAIAGAGHQKFRLVSQFVAAAFNFSINLYLIPRYSWLGAAWASLMTDGSLGAMNWLVAWRLLVREKNKFVPTPGSASGGQTVA